MGYTHYIRTQFHKAGTIEKSRFDNRYYVNDKAFNEKREKFCEVVYKVIETAKAEGIDCGNGWGEYYPVITAQQVNFSGSVRQRLTKYVRIQQPEDMDTPAFMNLLASAGVQQAQISVGASK